MMNLKYAKARIHDTECQDIVFSGMYCSEPILTVDDEGRIIDNYFIYSRSQDLATIGVPEVMFGIDSERGRATYISKDLPVSFAEREYPETFVSTDEMNEAMSRYVDLYPQIRDLLSREQIENAASIANEYLACLKKISGNMLFKFYEELYPSFFAWARCQK